MRAGRRMLRGFRLLATRAIAGLPSGSEPFSYAQPSIGTNQLYVLKMQNHGGQQQRLRSETFLLITLQPDEPLVIRLDLGVERALLSIVRAAYPEIVRVSGCVLFCGLIRMPLRATAATCSGTTI